MLIGFSDTKTEHFQKQKNLARSLPYLDQAYWNTHYESLCRIHRFFEKHTLNEAQKNLDYFCEARAIDDTEDSEDFFALRRLETYPYRVQNWLNRITGQTMQPLACCSANEWFWEIGGFGVFKRLGPIFHNLRLLATVFLTK